MSTWATVASCLVGLAFVGLALSIAAFTEFADYDDEGYVLVSLRGVDAGHSLYSETYSQYGPAFFGILVGGFRLLSLPITHDVARFATIVLTLTTATALAVATRRLTRSAAYGLLAFVGVGLSAPVGAEAALHPAHLALALIAGVVLLASGEGIISNSRAVAIGAMVGTLLLVKINIGLLAAVAVGATLLPISSKRGAGVRAIGVVAVPLAIGALAAQSGHASGLVGGLIVAACAFAAATRHWVTSDRSLIRPLLAGAGAAALVWVTVCLGSGTAWSDLIDGVVVGPLQLADAFSIGQRISTATLVVALGGLGAALLATTSHAVGLLERRPLVSGLLRAGTGGLLLVLAASPRVPQLDRLLPIDELVVAACLAWVPLVPRPGSRASLTRPRYAACVLAMLLPLQAYPVAGGQRFVGLVLLVVAACVSLSDGNAELARYVGSRHPHSSTRVERASTAAVLMLAVAIAGLWSTLEANQLGGTTRLGLYGASQVRLPTADAERLRLIVQRLERCETFFGLPGLNSFYLFADRDPPTWKNTGAWLTLFDTSTQAGVVRALSSYDEVCVLRNRSVESFWLEHGTEQVGPLRPFLAGESYDHSIIGPYEIDVIRPRGAAERD